MVKNDLAEKNNHLDICHMCSFPNEQLLRTGHVQNALLTNSIGILWITCLYKTQMRNTTFP